MTLDIRLPPAKPSWLARGALWLATFAALVALYGAALVRFQMVQAFPGFVAFASGLGLSVLAAVASLAAMVVVWRTGRTGGFRAILALAIAALTLAGPIYVAAKSASGARLDDVSTDLADPPRFDQAAKLRASGGAAVPNTIPAAEAEAQRAGYPDLGPLRLELPPDEVANLAVSLVEDRGWRLLGRTSFPRGGPPTGRIEAEARSAILALPEDVSIRIRAEATGSRVDMRSASRVAGIDFGGNAERIKSFLSDLSAAANVAP